MEDVMLIVDEKTRDLELCVSNLYNLLKIEDSISLGNSEAFKTILADSEVLNSYSNFFNDSKQFNVFYKICLKHINDTFRNKDILTKDDKNKVLLCLKDIKTLRAELNRNTTYSKFFEEIKDISKNLYNINNHLFLKDGNNTKEALKTYEKLLIKYKKIIERVNELASNMTKDEFELLKLDLNINYSALKANLNTIYKEILYSNSVIADPLLRKLSRDVNFNKYESTLNTSMVHKVVGDPEIRNNLLNNFSMLIESMNKIIDMYKDSRIVKRDTKIDVEIDTTEKKKDHGIDILPFIEDNYNDHRRKVQAQKIASEEKYDEKLNKLIVRFELLKRKLDRIESVRGSLSKEEVRLYNRLESELDELKKGKKTAIKFNIYFNKLCKRLKLYQNNNRQIVVEGRKKRK